MHDLHDKYFHRLSEFKLQSRNGTHRLGKGILREDHIVADTRVHDNKELLLAQEITCKEDREASKLFLAISSYPWLDTQHS